MRGRPFLRRLTAWAMLVLHGLVASGLPLPLAIPPAAESAAGRMLAAKDRSRPFPCMDKACGCVSAERCFTNCCCHTPAETLAWAKARGLEPAVVTALARRGAVAEPEPAPGSCCATMATKPACCEAAEPEKPSCCSVAEVAGGDERSPAAGRLRGGSTNPADSDDGARPTVVTLRGMLACGGIVAQWTAAGVALPPPPAVTCETSWPMIGLLVMGDESPLIVDADLEVPPPRGC